MVIINSCYIFLIKTLARYNINLHTNTHMYEYRVGKGLWSSYTMISEHNYRFDQRTVCK